MGHVREVTLRLVVWNMPKVRFNEPATRGDISDPRSEVTSKRFKNCILTEGLLPSPLEQLVLLTWHDCQCSCDSVIEKFLEDLEV